MKIRALKTFSVFTGSETKVFNAGKKGSAATEDDLDDATAERYIEAGYAEKVGGKASAKTESAPASESTPEEAPASDDAPAA